MWEERQSVKCRSPVGADLPAKAVCQSLHLLLHYCFAGKPTFDIQGVYDKGGYLNCIKTV